MPRRARDVQPGIVVSDSEVVAVVGPGNFIGGTTYELPTVRTVDISATPVVNDVDHVLAVDVSGRANGHNAFALLGRSERLLIPITVNVPVNDVEEIALLIEPAIESEGVNLAIL